MKIIIEVEGRIRIGMMNTKEHTMATEDIEDRMTDMTMVMADMDQVMAAVPTAVSDLGMKRIVVNRDGTRVVGATISLQEDPTPPRPRLGVDPSIPDRKRTTGRVQGTLDTETPWSTAGQWAPWGMAVVGTARISATGRAAADGAALVDLIETKVELKIWAPKAIKTIAKQLTANPARIRQRLDQLKFILKAARMVKPECMAKVDRMAKIASTAS